MLHSRFWQGFFALAPLIVIFVALIGYLFFVFRLVTHMPEIEASGGDVSPSFILGNVGMFMIMVIFAVLLSLGSLIFYIVHAVQNPNLKDNNLLVVWVLLFVFVSGIGQLIYWIVEILGKSRDQSVSERTY